MSDVEFRPDQDIDSSFESVSVDKRGAVTKILMKLSFGTIKTEKQANNAMVVVIIIAFALSAYFFLR